MIKYAEYQRLPSLNIRKGLNPAGITKKEGEGVLQFKIPTPSKSIENIRNLCLSANYTRQIEVNWTLIVIGNYSQSLYVFDNYS
jgi:hypothetical protein